MLQILDDGQALDKSHLQAASQLHGEIHDVIVTSCSQRPHTVAEQIKEDRVARSYLPEGIFSEDILRGSEVIPLRLVESVNVSHQKTVCFLASFLLMGLGHLLRFGKAEYISILLLYTGSQLMETVYIIPAQYCFVEMKTFVIYSVLLYLWNY